MCTCMHRHMSIYKKNSGHGSQVQDIYMHPLQRHHHHYHHLARLHANTEPNFINFSIIFWSPFNLFEHNFLWQTIETTIYIKLSPHRWYSLCDLYQCVTHFIPPAGQLVFKVKGSVSHQHKCADVCIQVHISCC